MSLTVSFSKGGLASGKLMDPGWKIAEITNVAAETAKSSGKDGFIADFKILAPSKYEEVTCRDFFYGQMGEGKLGKLIGAVMGKEAEADKEYNLEPLVGQRVKIWTEVTKNPTSGNPQNSVMDYRNINDANAEVRN